MLHIITLIERLQLYTLYMPVYFNLHPFKDNNYTGLSHLDINNGATSVIASLNYDIFKFS